MKKILKQITAAVLVLTLTAGTLPFEPGELGALFPDHSITASAASIKVNWDESTKTLTISGDMSLMTSDSLANYRDKTEHFVAGGTVSGGTDYSTFMPKSCSALFRGFSVLKDVDLTAASFENTTTLRSMFSSCPSLTTVRVTDGVSPNDLYR